MTKLRMLGIDLFGYSRLRDLDGGEDLLPPWLIRLRDETEAVRLEKGITEAWAYERAHFLGSLYRIMECVTSMVERLMERTPNLDFCKMVVAVIPPSESKVPLISSDGICTVFVPYEAWHLIDMDDLGRKEAVISLILRALDVLEEAEGIALPNVRAACAEVKARGYENVWVAARRRSRWRYTAEVEVDYDTNGVRVHMNITDPKGVLVKRVLLAEDQVRPYSLYYQYLGKLAWESKEKATLTTPSGAVFEVDISDCL